jgi:hypothetical protein
MPPKNEIKPPTGVSLFSGPAPDYKDPLYGFSGDLFFGFDDYENDYDSMTDCVMQNMFL